MFVEGTELKKRISIAVTTYSKQSYYTHACLEAIRPWKNDQHELIVACHDQSLLLEFYLKGCERDGLIDQLLFTQPGYGHLRGVNLCFENASGEFFFNICNDMLIGDFLVADCANRLCDSSLGMIGWHWYDGGDCEGERWRGDGSLEYNLRQEDSPWLGERDEANIRQAHWFTGKTFEAVGGPKWIQLCNTSFFGIRRDLWRRLGGFDYQKYYHWWADDFLSYAVLDQGLDVLNLGSHFRRKPYFAGFDQDNQDVPDCRRDEDRIDLPPDLEKYAAHLGGGLTKPERQLLFQIAKSLGAHKTVLHVGVGRGAGLILFLKGMQQQPTQFIGIDLFDDGQVSCSSSQPQIGEEYLRHVSPFLASHHNLRFIKGDTLTLTVFPEADVIFIDAGHTKECIEHDIRLAKKAVKPDGMLIFHDYGQPIWPDVQVAIDAAFESPQIRTFATLAIIQMRGATERCESEF